MGMHQYNTIDELNNVIDNIPSDKKGQNVALLAEQLLNGKWQLRLPDDLDQYIQTVDPNVTMPPRLLDEANRYRDQLLDAGFTFQGHNYQSRTKDRENISGRVQMATLALMNGAQPGDLRWHGEDYDFSFIDEENNLVPMDAQTMVDLGETAAKRHSRIIRAARTVKDKIETGDVTSLNEVRQEIDYEVGVIAS